MTDADAELTSIIIPGRDAAAYLREAIDSVLCQRDCGKVEIVFVDDASRDDSPAIAAEMGCRVVAIPPSGPVAARNRGIAETRGGLILFHDADDVMEPNGLAVMRRALWTAPETGVVLAMRKDFVSPDLSEEETRRVVPQPEPYFGVLAGCALIRRDVFDQVGLFDATVQAGEMYAWLNALQKQAVPTLRLPVVTVNRRLHRGNFGRVNRAPQYADYAAILRRTLRARRP